jgi:hypothetical protein
MQMPPVKWPADDDIFDEADFGRLIRKHIHWPMDRPKHANALISFRHHLDAPFCMLHAGMRITEKMLEFLQVGHLITS